MRDRSLLAGSLTVVVAAAGFGLLGPLARFAYDTGLEPISFVAWRAAFATAIVVAFASWRIRRGRAFVAPWRIAASERAALGVATVCAFTLNLGMFIAFDRISVAVALLAFYTYPAMVAAVEIALGREPLDGVRATSLGLSLGGMVLVVAGGFAGGYLTSAFFNPMTRERGDHMIIAVVCLVATAVAIAASIVTGLPYLR